MNKQKPTRPWPDINGEWINQNGSVVEFNVDNRLVTGWYDSKKGRAARDRKYPITGQQNGELIAFLVDWKDGETNLHAITSFSGRIIDNGKEIHTMWILARQYEDETHDKPTGAWNAFLTNSDVFVRYSG